jgi:indole-3-glycerol phosphate synthase
MWEKETEVDRLRERVPLSNLVSQCKLSDMDPSKPKPRDWIGTFKSALANTDFVIIPEIKRLEPKYGTLRKRFDLLKLSKQVVASKSPVLSVNCDGVLFGGSMEDVTTVRENLSSAALDSPDAKEGIVTPPILASDLVLYPYQLYKLRLAGTDAVNMIVGALSGKDLLYLTKIAATLKIQVIASVSSAVQIRSLTKLGGGVEALVISNRDLETFGIDESGEQVLSLLQSEALKEFKEKFGPEVPILVEGRVGIIKRSDDDNETSTAKAYIDALKEAGAVGAIIGSGLVTEGKVEMAEVIQSLQSAK